MIAYALERKKVLEYVLEQSEVSLDDISETFSANKGYLNVALRGLASQGWLDYNIKGTHQVILNANDRTAIASSLIPHYNRVT